MRKANVLKIIVQSINFLLLRWFKIRIVFFPTCCSKKIGILNNINPEYKPTSCYVNVTLLDKNTRELISAKSWGECE